MTTLPRVTFLIPHYNYEEYLPDAIASAKAQTYPNIGVCVIDDASDNIGELTELVDKHLLDGKIDEHLEDGKETIRKGGNHTAIFLSDNKKQAYARNRGIEETWDETDFYIMLDADDVAHPQKVERMMQIMTMSQHIGVVCADYDTIDERERMAREFKQVYDLDTLRRECIVHSGSLIRKEALSVVREDYGYFDPELPPVEDYDLWMRIAENFMIIHIAESLTVVRVHSQNSTNTSTHEYRMQRLQKLYQKLAQRLNV
jgi:glycosyltransferase involved in cell wall biosynthesis